MKNTILFTLLMFYAVPALAQETKVKLNIEVLPSDERKREIPLILNLQLVDDIKMEEYVDQFFLEDEREEIRQMHSSGEISDSLLSIYEADWKKNPIKQVAKTGDIEFDYFELSEDGENWNRFDEEVYPLKLITDSDEDYASQLLLFGIDPGAAFRIEEGNAIRAVLKDGKKSNAIKIDVPASSSIQLNPTDIYYIANYWMLREDYTRMLSYAERFIALDNSIHGGYYLKGVAKYFLNEKAEAFQAVKTALTIYQAEDLGNEPPDQLLEYYYILIDELGILEER